MLNETSLKTDYEMFDKDINFYHVYTITKDISNASKLSCQFVMLKISKLQLALI